MWVEIQNREEALASGVAHVSVMARKKSAPIWELEWIEPHLAITTEALARSVIRPFKSRGAYPERYQEALARWKEDERAGKAFICTTTVQVWLAGRPAVAK